MNIDNCLIPTTFCGKLSKNIPKKNIKENLKYVSRGTPISCMQKGIGTGIHLEKRKNLPTFSLQQIKFIGEQYENKFYNKNIKDIIELINYVKIHTKSQNEKLLKSVLTMKNKNVDYKAYNSIIHFLYYSSEISISKLPFCKKI
jgi:hypothetical protein